MDHVEGGYRLVQHDELGLCREGTGYGNTLALATAELVRISVAVKGLEADHFQQFVDLTLDLLFCQTLVRDERLGDD